jgi:hypothetical protein
MDIKSKTLKLAQTYTAINNARSILDGLEEQTSNYASGDSFDLALFAKRSLSLKKAQEVILTSFIESVLDEKGEGGSKVKSSSLVDRAPT